MSVPRIQWVLSLYESQNIEYYNVRKLQNYFRLVHALQKFKLSTEWFQFQAIKKSFANKQITGKSSAIKYRWKTVLIFNVN